MITKASLQKLYLRQLTSLPTPEEVLEWFKVLEAGWVYSGDYSKPHAQFHSGKHGDVFFLCKRVLAHGNLREILAACMIAKMEKLTIKKIDGVFGSPYSSVLLAGDIGRLLGAKTYVPEKDPTDPKGKRMLFKSDDRIPEGDIILQIEELVTTFDSGEATKQAVIDSNPNPITFAPLVLALVNRPPVIEHVLLDGRALVPFIERQASAWEPADCPLCKAGSEPVTPKGSNWAKLTA
jgi:orotate phosphoribosyltransferase